MFHSIITTQTSRPHPSVLQTSLLR